MFQDESVKTILTRSHKAPRAARHPASTDRVASFCAASGIVRLHLVSQRRPISPLPLSLGRFTERARRIHFYRFRLNDFKSFNSLSKVLFIFPSQYLFAIGFLHVFSLRRSLSPALRTSIKVRDSSMASPVGSVTTDGALTLFGGRLGDTSASGRSVRLTAFRSQFAVRRTEITTVGFSRFRRPY